MNNIYDNVYDNLLTETIHFVINNELNKTDYIKYYTILYDKTNLQVEKNLLHKQTNIIEPFRDEILDEVNRIITIVCNEQLNYIISNINHKFVFDNYINIYNTLLNKMRVLDNLLGYYKRSFEKNYIFFRQQFKNKWSEIIINKIYNNFYEEFTNFLDDYDSKNIILFYNHIKELHVVYTKKFRELFIEDFKYKIKNKNFKEFSEIEKFVNIYYILIDTFNDNNNIVRSIIITFINDYIFKSDYNNLIENKINNIFTTFSVIIEKETTNKNIELQNIVENLNKIITMYKNVDYIYPSYINNLISRLISIDLWKNEIKNIRIIFEIINCKLYVFNQLINNPYTYSDFYNLLISDSDINRHLNKPNFIMNLITYIDNYLYKDISINYVHFRYLYIILEIVEDKEMFGLKYKHNLVKKIINNKCNIVFEQYILNTIFKTTNIDERSIIKIILKDYIKSKEITQQYNTVFNNNNELLLTTYDLWGIKKNIEIYNNNTFIKELDKFKNEFNYFHSCKYEKQTIDHSNVINGYYEPDSTAKNQYIKVGVDFKF